MTTLCFIYIQNIHDHIHIQFNTKSLIQPLYMRTMRSGVNKKYLIGDIDSSHRTEVKGIDVIVP